jgi:hypothetical protein
MVTNFSSKGGIMKAKTFRMSLECVRGSVLPQLDCVEITGSTLRASDCNCWAEATLQEPISGQAVLPYSKLRSIVRTLDEGDDIEIELDGAICRVKVSTALWQLNLLNTSIEPLPEFPVINTIEASGYNLLEAHKSLKHLIHTDLSRPGLMWAWTNENQELVIGNGTSLGGYHTGIGGIELPTILLTEIWRILGVHLSEKVTFHIGEKYIHAMMRDTHFHATLPNAPRFETDWYHKVRNLLEDPQVIRMSRSDLLRAINQVKVTAYDSTAMLAPANGNLLLASKDEHGNKSGSRIEAFGILKEPISLNIDYLSSGADALTDELITVKVCKSVVEVSDTKGWEIIFRR